MLRGFLVFWFFGMKTRMNKGIAKNTLFWAFWFLVFWSAFTKPPQNTAIMAI